ncbi:MAG: PQQ-dependent sugar dehydrogenase [Nitrososphaeraceae archaeon]|nr:PQQ-dependent sugar dehydrogenase [Nitrososphaeraceae archaeon]
MTCLSESAGQVILKERPYSLSPVNPRVFDSSLKVEQVVEGLQAPTTMAFLGPDDFLVLEKNNGTVIRVLNGKILNEPLLDINVANSVERGMCGIAVSKNGTKTYVFLYFTEIKGNDGDDRKGIEPIGNRLYRYEFVDDKLVNPKLLLDLPAYPGPRHNGGAIEIGPDNNLYIPIGDVDGSFKSDFQHTQIQNFAGGKVVADGRSGILRITQDGEPVGEGILGDSMPLGLYYAYGIRNSFGLDFDPVTGFLWDTENGPQDGDEINLVEPGFNSGWNEIYGFSSSRIGFDLNELVTFDDRGHYEEPKLVWTRSTGLTGIIFLDSDRLGDQYRNDMFVGSVNNGHIYHFELNSQRNDIAVPQALATRLIQNPINVGAQNVIFASGLGGVTDLTVGPDGYLYIVSISQGKIFRILPYSSGINDTESNSGERLSALQSEEQQNIPTGNLSKTKDIGYENNDLLVSIKALKNSVARGDSQNVTITVTDFASRPIANAEISGLLKYPGDNYEKEFSGITDSQGKFVYSWIIGENGDVGPLSIEVGVSSQAYPSASAVSSFEIVGSSAEIE